MIIYILYTCNYLCHYICKIKLRALCQSTTNFCLILNTSLTISGRQQHWKSQTLVCLHVISLWCSLYIHHLFPCGVWLHVSTVCMYGWMQQFNLCQSFLSVCLSFDLSESIIDLHICSSFPVKLLDKRIKQNLPLSPIVYYLSTKACNSESCSSRPITFNMFNVNSHFPHSQP